jgi:hypothetical protein
MVNLSARIFSFTLPGMLYILHVWMISSVLSSTLKKTSVELAPQSPIVTSFLSHYGDFGMDSQLPELPRDPRFGQLSTVSDFNADVPPVDEPFTFSLSVDNAGYEDPSQSQQQCQANNFNIDNWSETIWSDLSQCPSPMLQSFSNEMINPNVDGESFMSQRHTTGKLNEDSLPARLPSCSTGYCSLPTTKPSKLNWRNAAQINKSR